MLFTTEMQDTNDELSAQLLNHGLEEGRHLLTMNLSNGDMGHSLAAEFEAMSQDEVNVMFDSFFTFFSNTTI